ncbi:hypothetical protein M2140_000027 [Clostridiales Family XIII bacterium PM5-7]
MNIKIWDDKYVIKSDAYNYFLREIKTKQPKDDDGGTVSEVDVNDDGTYEVTVANCDTVSRCLIKLVELEGRKNRCGTLEGYIKHLEKIEDKLNKTLESVSLAVGGDNMLKRALSQRTTEDEKPVAKKTKKK